METGRREEARCQSGQLDGNKAAVDGDVFESVSPPQQTHNEPAKATHTHTPTHLQ